MAHIKLIFLVNKRTSISTTVSYKVNIRTLQNNRELSIKSKVLRRRLLLRGPGRLHRLLLHDMLRHRLLQHLLLQRVRILQNRRFRYILHRVRPILERRLINRGELRIRCAREVLLRTGGIHRIRRGVICLILIRIRLGPTRDFVRTRLVLRAGVPVPSRLELVLRGWLEQLRARVEFRITAGRWYVIVSAFVVFVGSAIARVGGERFRSRVGCGLRVAFLRGGVLARLPVLGAFVLSGLLLLVSAVRSILVARLRRVSRSAVGVAAVAARVAVVARSIIVCAGFVCVSLSIVALSVIVAFAGCLAVVVCATVNG